MENRKGHQMFLLSFSSQSHCFATLPWSVFISLLVLTRPSPICSNHPSGLLTVEPERRLKLSDLKENSWLQGGASMSTTPLCTPDVLESSGPTVRTYVNATYKVKALCSNRLKQMNRTLLFTFVIFFFLSQAFNRGKREGFFLKSVDNAPLAKRRKLKMTSTGVETRWSSSSSSSSSSTSSSASAATSKVQPKETVSPKQS